MVCVYFRNFFIGVRWDRKIRVRLEGKMGYYRFFVVGRIRMILFCVVRMIYRDGKLRIEVDYNKMSKGRRNGWGGDNGE